MGWAAFVFSLQSWLGESAEAKSSQSTPGYFSVGMACKCRPRQSSYFPGAFHLYLRESLDLQSPLTMWDV